MSRLEELIQELCPDGVEYKTLGEIATDIYRGSGIKRDQVTEEGIPCVRYGEIYTTYGIWFDTCVSHTKEEYVSSPKYFSHGDILFAITGENIEDIAKSCAYVGNEKCLAGGDTVVLKHDQDPKYLAYALSTLDAQKQKGAGKVKSKVVHASVPSIKSITIPLPPLPVQREMVRILDNFTLLTAELTAELTARKKQYEYYRDALLRFDSAESTAPTKFLSRLLVQHCPNGVEYKALGESAAIVRGASPRPIRKFITTESTGVNWIKIGDVKPGDKYITASAEKITQEGAKKSRAVKKGDFILSNSMSFGRPYILKIDGCIHDGWLAISDFSDSYLPDFLYYLLNSNSCQSEMRKRASFGGAVQNLNADIVRALVLPVPPLPVQKEIVAILDRFDTLCHDITQGLPAEIEARKKQYEYYRDRLLRLPPAAK